jgi:hypothetical protein
LLLGNLWSNALRLRHGKCSRAFFAAEGLSHSLSPLLHYHRGLGVRGSLDVDGGLRLVAVDWLRCELEVVVGLALGEGALVVNL